MSWNILQNEYFKFDFWKIGIYYSDTSFMEKTCDGYAWNLPKIFSVKAIQDCLSFSLNLFFQTLKFSKSKNSFL